MDVLKRISVIIMALVFVLASGGILMVHTFCACANTEIASLYTVPEHCSPHTQANHSVKEEAQSCQTATSCCLPTEAETLSHAHHDASTSNCESSDFVYLKIDSQFLTSESQIIKAPDFPLLFSLVSLHQLTLQAQAIPTQQAEYAHPPSQLTGRDFILSCQQIKIPHSA